MATYILLTRIDPSRLEGRSGYLELYEKVRTKLRRDAADVSWRESWAVLGPYDYLDVFDAPDNDAATRVASIVRAEGGTQAEVWPATPWRRFKELVEGGRAQPRRPDRVTEAGEESFPASDPPTWTQSRT